MTDQSGLPQGGSPQDKYPNGSSEQDPEPATGLSPELSFSREDSPGSSRHDGGEKDKKPTTGLGEGLAPVPEGNLLLDSNLQVASADPAFQELFEVSEAKIEGRSVFEIEGGLFDRPQLRSLLEELSLEEASEQGSSGESSGEGTPPGDMSTPGHVSVEQGFGPLGRRELRFEARLFPGSGLTLFTVKDLTERRRDLAATRRLQETSTRLIQEDDIDVLYREVLGAVIAIMDADFASMQKLGAGREELELLAHRGFSPEAAEFWEQVESESESTCGKALETGGRVVVPDVERCEFLAGTRDLETYRQTGIRAVQSTPLISRSGDMLGMISTHWNAPHEPPERDLRLLDVLARQAADLIERRQSEKALRESEERYRMLFESIDEGFCTIEVLFGEDGEPEDYRFLETNPAFEEQTGLSDVEGKRIRELEPDFEEHWFETYGRIAQTGEPERFINEAKRLDRWFDVYAFRIGEPKERKVAILFKDITERKRAKEELQEREEHLSALLETAPDCIKVVAEDGTLIQMNSAGLEIAKADSASAMEGECIYDFVAPEHRQKYRQFNERICQGERGTLQFDVINLEGERRHLESHAAPLRLSDGDLAQLAVTRDVTQRKRDKEALRDSEKRLRLATDAAELGVFEWDIPNDRVSCENDRMYEIFQQSREREPINAAEFASEVAHPDDAGAFETAVEEALETGRFYFVGRFRRRDGELRWVEFTGQVQYEPDGTPVRMPGVATDITKQKEQEKYLREAKSRFEAATKAGAVGTWEWHIPDDRIVVNSSFARTFGVDPEAAREGVPLKRLVSSIHEDDRERVEQAIEEAVESCGEYEEEYRVWNADREVRWVVARGHVECDEEGTPVTFPGALTDITERKEAEEALRELKESLEARVRRRTEQLREMASRLTMAEQRERDRIARVLHDDLQQRLYGSRIKISTLQEELISKGQEGLADRIGRVEEEVDEITHALRELSVGMSPPVLENDGLRGTMEWLKSYMKETRGLDTHLLAEREFKMEDEDKRVLLFQVVRELLTNVDEHSGVGQAEIELREEEGSLIIEVVDEGRGFDPGKVREEKPIESFGLTAARERVRLFGGELQVRSAPGKGTQVTVRMPMEKSQGPLSVAFEDGELPS